jgi:hypothetical protein
MLKDLRTYNYKGTAVLSIPASIRDELISCQHNAESVGECVHMEADYVFDASLDDSLTPQTKNLCMELVREFPSTEVFTFNP